MLYQLSYVRKRIPTLPEECSVTTPGSQIHSQGQDPIDETCVSIANDREILEIGLSLLNKQCSFISTNWRQVALLYRSCALTKPSDHVISGEFLLSLIHI